MLRAREVLKAFRVLGEDLCLTDVIDRTRLPKTTVFRLLRSLVHGGLLERAGSGVYRNRFGLDGHRTRTSRPHHGQQPIFGARDPTQR